MTVLNDPEFIPFLIRAKRNTYAGNTGKVASSRAESNDLAYQEGEWSYYDTYLGGFAFAGEEAVWKAGAPVWSMNYYGTMVGDDLRQVPDGFSEFLKRALLAVPADAPYRGPASFSEGRFSYTCRWSGDLRFYTGDETITLDGQTIYRLNFHGGIIL